MLCHISCILSRQICGQLAKPQAPAPGCHVTPQKVNATVTLTNTITSLAHFSYFHPKYVPTKTPPDYMTTKLKRNEPYEEIRDKCYKKRFVCMWQIFLSKIVPMLTKMSRLIKPKILVMQSEPKILFLTKFTPLINQVKHRRLSVMWINERAPVRHPIRHMWGQASVVNFHAYLSEKTERFPEGNYINYIQYASSPPTIWQIKCSKFESMFLKPLYRIEQLHNSKF